MPSQPIVSNNLQDYAAELLRLERQKRMNDSEAKRIRISDLLSTTPVILPLFHVLGGIVPEEFLNRASSPQPRWNKDGQKEMKMQQYSLEESPVRDLFEEGKFIKIVEGLVELELIQKSSSPQGYQIYVYKPTKDQFLFYHNKLEWIQCAFELCCHVFPRHTSLETSFAKTGNQLLPLLRHVLYRFAELGLQVPERRESIETLLAASEFEELTTRTYFMAMLSTFSTIIKYPDLHVQHTLRCSVLLRLGGHPKDSQRLISEFVKRYPLTDGCDAKLRLSYRLLAISQAENSRYNHLIHSDPDTLRPLSLPASLLSAHVIRRQMLSEGLSYRCSGDLAKAQTHLDFCLYEIIDLPASTRLLVICNLTDVYCELHSRETFLPSQFLDKADQLLAPEVARLRKSKSASRHFRRSLLSLIELQLLRCQRPTDLILEVLNIYKSLGDIDSNDEHGHLRAQIALARTSPTSVEAWTNVLNLSEKYWPSEENSFHRGVTFLLQSLAMFNQKRECEAWKAFHEGSQILRVAKPHFLIPGYASYIYHAAEEELRCFVGSTGSF